MSIRVVAASLLLVILHVGPLVAQTEDRPAFLEAGRTSFSFRLPESGVGTVGVWRVSSERTEWGLLFSAGVRWHNIRYDDPSAPDATTRSARIGLQPMVRRYTRVSRTVAPYLFGGLFLAYDRRSSSESQTRGTVTGDALHAGAQGGLGVEWLPRPELGIGSRVGIQGGYSRGVDDTSLRARERGGFLETFTTNVYLRLFLP